jgi:hypothetical protein
LSRPEVNSPLRVCRVISWCSALAIAMSFRAKKSDQPACLRILESDPHWRPVSQPAAAKIRFRGSVRPVPGYRYARGRIWRNGLSRSSCRGVRLTHDSQDPPGCGSGTISGDARFHHWRANLSRVYVMSCGPHPSRRCNHRSRLLVITIALVAAFCPGEYHSSGASPKWWPRRRQ